MINFNNIKLGITLFLISLMVLKVQGQIRGKELTDQKVIWTTVTETVEWNDHWFTTVNVQDRLFIETPGSFQLLLNTISYYTANDNLSLGGGFLFFNFRRRLVRGGSLKDVDEWRSYQSIKISTKKNRWKLTNRLNVEERFQQKIVNEALSDKYKFSFRFRLKWECTYELWQNQKGNKLSLLVSTEPMLNAGSTIVNNTFDQNRFITQFFYQISSSWSINSGYMNWIFQRSNGASFDIRHVWLIGLSHKLFYN